MAEIKAAVSGVLEKDVAAVQGFSERQLRALAKQAAWIAEATANGELDDDLRAFFLENLDAVARNFADTLVGLAALTVEKVWNAVVGVLWKAIERAAGIALGRPF